MQFHNKICAAIVVSSLGVTIATAEDKQEDEHHMLDEIIVAATPLERTVEQLAQPTSILSGDALIKKQAASIGETLAGELGVNATDFGPVASRPVIRGQFGERVRVLSNGLDTLDASALSEDHAVSVDSILAKSVEVVRGPATLLYGSGAAGGIINIVDSRLPEGAHVEPFSGTLGLNADTALGTRAGAISLDFGTGNVAAHLDWFRRDTDDIEIPGFAESSLLRALEAAEGGETEDEAGGTVDNSASEAESGAAGLTFEGSRGFVGVAVSRYASNYGVPGHAHGHEAEAGAGEEEAISIDLDQTRYDVRAVYESDGIFEKTSLRLAQNDYRHTEFEGADAGTRYDTDGTDVRLELQHRPFGNLEGAVGFQFKRIDLKAEGDEAFVPGSETSQLSLFAFEEYSLAESWVLQGSARIERQTIKTPVAKTFEDTAAGASIGVIRNLPRSLTLSANLSLTERHPNATELYADGPHVAVQRFERGSVVLGNGVLDKEVSTNLDVTLRGATDRLEWTLTGYINDVDDYVLLAPTGEEVDELPAFDYGQADVELYGAEAELLVDLFENDDKHLHARLFADFVHGEEKSSGAYLPRLPPLRLGLGLHYRGERLDGSISATYNRKQDKHAVNELPTESFTMLNAELSYTFEAPALLVFLRGSNLGDTDARRHTSPLKDLVPLPGRSLHLGVRLDF